MPYQINGMDYLVLAVVQLVRDTGGQFLITLQQFIFLR